MVQIGFKQNGNSEANGGKKTFEVLPVATYNVEIAKVSYKPIDLNKTPWPSMQKLVDRGVEGMISFAFKITDGPHAKRWVWTEVPAEITDSSKCDLRLYLQEILQQNELPEGFSFNEEDFAHYVGLPCRVRVGQYWSDKYNEYKNKVEDVLMATAAQMSATTQASQPKPKAVVDDYESF